ncbi:MAG TPA: GNAT family N-acetyltransferase [Ktedonobacterales bacterium]|nr:GNAT family N-acetyltransferase [Ktedonobacterales bacterium]
MPDKAPNATPYTITRATLADLGAVIDLYEDAARWLTARGIDQWRPGDYTVERARGNIERDVVYLAWREGRPVGKFTLVWDDPEVWGEQPPDAGYVHGLAVARSEAGLGVVMLRYAARMVAQAGRRYLRLDCLASNQALRDYYTRAGFTHCEDKWYDGWSSSLFEQTVEAAEIQEIDK